jgi:hypothetical protein
MILLNIIAYVTIVTIEIPMTTNPRSSISHRAAKRKPLPFLSTSLSVVATHADDTRDTWMMPQITIKCCDALSRFNFYLIKIASGDAEQKR